jgi:hypothetical protein
MWTFGGVRVFVQKLPNNLKQIIARLQPVQGPTVYQIFGYEKDITKLQAYVVGETDKDTLDNFFSSGNSYTLSGYWGVVGDFYVSNMSFDPLPKSRQTIRPDLDCESQVYMVDMELFKE